MKDGVIHCPFGQNGRTFKDNKDKSLRGRSGGHKVRPKKKRGLSPRPTQSVRVKSMNDALIMTALFNCVVWPGLYLLWERLSKREEERKERKRNDSR